MTNIPVFARRPADKGLTLAEVLIAMVFLVFVLTGMLALFIHCAFLNEANRNLVIATSHAQFAMEEVKSTTFLGVSPGYNGFCWNTAGITAKGLSPLRDENLCFRVTGTTDLDVTVTVNWLDLRSRARTTALETIISEP